MSQTVASEELLRRVCESGVLSKSELRAAMDELGGEAAAMDAGELIRGLADAGYLTTFQASTILNGQLPNLSVGTYVVLDRLGAGGASTVYKARHRLMKRVVALKLLSREGADKDSFARRFRREVETIAQFNHPNIVMAFDADESDSGLFLAMELVDGRDLGAEVAAGGPLSAADAVECTLQAAWGLAYAHDHGVVHRDIKPANLLRDWSGVVKVADLGLASVSASESGSVNTSLTVAGEILGTLAYMAPEQALDSTTVDHRADVYSLGCTLYFLLTGRCALLGHFNDVPDAKASRRTDTMASRRPA